MPVNDISLTTEDILYYMLLAQFIEIINRQVN